MSSPILCTKIKRIKKKKERKEEKKGGRIR